MADIRNLKVRAGNENSIKVNEVDGLFISSVYKDVRLPSIDKKIFAIEAHNGRWQFDLDEVTYFEFDVVVDKRLIHVSSRATTEDNTKDESL